MVRAILRAAVLCASVALIGGFFVLHNSLVQAYGPGGTCEGYCQDQGSNNFAAPSPAPYFQRLPAQSTPVYAAPGPRTFAGGANHDCPQCRAEREQGPPAGPSNFAAATNNFAAGPTGYDASLDRPRLMPRNMPPRQAGYPMMDPYARGMRPNMPRGFQQNASGMPIPVEPLPAGSKRGQPAGGLTAPPTTIPEGMALVLQDDSPLMSGGEQLGSIDREQTMRVLDIRGNWVQLETNWLGKNAWIRRNQVRMNDNNQPPNDIAPPAT